MKSSSFNVLLQLLQALSLGLPNGIGSEIKITDIDVCCLGASSGSKRQSSFLF
jgi:hypothetical protein